MMFCTRESEIINQAMAIRIPEVVPAAAETIDLDCFERGKG
jgi:hypothetical protein